MSPMHTKKHTDEPSRPIRFVMDRASRRPACVLLQAAYGASPQLGRFFDARHWLTAPTPDMRMVEGTADEWRQYAARLDKGVT